MADVNENKNIDAVEELLNSDRKEQETMSKGEKFLGWFESNKDDIIGGVMVLGMIGAVTGLCVASIKADERVKKAAIEERARDRELQEKWMDTQLECARIEADAMVRKQTETTKDIAAIVKTVADK